MGNQRQLNHAGGFSEYLYTSNENSVVVNGVKGHVIEYADKAHKPNWDLPPYSNTSDVYFRRNDAGEVVQAKVYLSRTMLMDFDWDHHHKNIPSGEHFPIGTIHVQTYKKDRNGRFIRLSNEARRMTAAEKEKYGPILRYFNPNVIL